MSKENQIRYIQHHEIDAEKWNRCIGSAANSRFYANDWHLDRAAVIWDALVWGDYEIVMPLPVRKKFGIKYVYQPLYCQQLGIFPEPSILKAHQFYEELIKKFRYADIHLNSANPPFEKNQDFSFLPRKNYLILLDKDYKSLANDFNTNTKRNIAKAYKNNLHLIAGIRLEEYLEFKEKQESSKISQKDLGKLKNIIAFGQYKGTGEIYGVYDIENNLRAAAYFCRWKDRVIYLNATSDEQG
ncbi:MAG: hypothetical protein JXR31_10310, partial [Prolixibacteraceae bacterium]|nr:hypothetical protein [Prolixibacteraceae bacterium]